MTMTEFCEHYGITMKVKQVDSNPQLMVAGDWPATHWKCHITSNVGKAITIIFSMGIGHNGAEPTVENVIDCLAQDASTYDNAAGFEEWAAELGYDTDSRKAERGYLSVEKQTLKLRMLLGDAFEQCLYEVDHE